MSLATSIASGNVEGIKYVIDESGKINWRGFSGVLQFFYRWPFGFSTLKDNRIAVRFNQIFWNVLIFVCIFGAIYKLLIDMGSIDVNEKIQEQTPNTYLQGVYFSVVTTTTLGFGDIYPKTLMSQTVVFIHLVLMVLLNIIWLCNFGISS